MTLQPAPGAGVVRRDAHTIPPREPRDGRRIGTPISAEEPEFVFGSRALDACSGLDSTVLGGNRLAHNARIATPPDASTMQW